MCIHLILAKRPKCDQLVDCRVRYMRSSGNKKQPRTESEGTTAVDQVPWTVTLKMAVIPRPLVSVLQTREGHILRPRQATELVKGFGGDGQFRGPVLPEKCLWEAYRLASAPAIHGQGSEAGERSSL